MSELDKVREVAEELFTAAHHAAGCLIDIEEEAELSDALRAQVESSVRAVGLAMAHWKALA